jgi:hypothetical protein
MQRKLGFKLARIVLEKYLYLQRAQEPQQARYSKTSLRKLSRQALEYFYHLRISEAEMDGLLVVESDREWRLPRSIRNNTKATRLSA